MLWNKILKVKNGLLAFGACLTVASIPLKLNELLPPVSHWLGKHVMLDREILWASLSVFLAVWIFWIDLRPYITSWWRRRKDSEENLESFIIWWIPEMSAWGQWQTVQGVMPLDEHKKLDFVAFEICRLARSGALTITARKASAIERESLTPDLWEVAYIKINPDPLRAMQTSVQPGFGVSEEVADKIRSANYISLRAKWSDIHRLWPEKDRQIDALIKRALAETKVRYITDLKR